MNRKTDIRCDACGADADPSWVYCASCSTRLQDNDGKDDNPPPQVRRDQQRLSLTTMPTRIWSGSLFIAAAIATIVALFPHFFAHFAPLASKSSNIALQVPAIIGWALAGTLIIAGRTKSTVFGTGLGVAVSVLAAASFLPSVIDVVDGHNIAAAGFWCGFGGIVAGLWAGQLSIGELRSYGHMVSRHPRRPHLSGWMALAAAAAYV